MPGYRWRRRKRSVEIAPDEIFIDSSNIPEFDSDQLEGRIEQPIGRQSLMLAAAILAVLMVLYAGRAWDLQFIQGTAYAKQAAENQLSERVLFADRGVITDRNGTPLAYNERGSVTDDFASRVYATFRGISHVVGYIKPPAKDSSGFYFRTSFEGIDGVEKAYNDQLSGENGTTLTETDAKGAVVSQSVKVAPVSGEKLTLSIDANVNQALYDSIAAVAQQSDFQGGAGVIMDVQTGELLAMTSYPEYSSQALSDGDQAAIAALNTDPHQPFLNRATSGLYAPGSIVKPFMGVAALNEGVIDETKQILSTGSISLPNPYDPAHPSIFKDWRPNGWVDVEQAIAVSSDVYFYEVGGGFEDQPGLGIDRIDRYLHMFGFGSTTGLLGFNEAAGNIPTPAWKVVNFPADPTWRIGDTYHTAIGQYGTQVTPLQAVRAVASLANGGMLVTPTLIASSTPAGVKLPLPAHPIEVVTEGMRMGVTEGIATAVNVPYVAVAAKTGTAQVGTQNQYLNSWMVGFFPYDNPRYAYAVVLEKGPAGTLIGASAAVRNFLDWMHAHASNYLN
ncbi:MAG TPA: penicillin-binding transpeptidase domain-containing protein [Candidatus Paceibacterota bacterium]|nr:penicillin-binding transpeptidase domain-containing protein [Candidatus Paceibacterota bacterium]